MSISSEDTLETVLHLGLHLGHVIILVGKKHVTCPTQHLNTMCKSLRESRAAEQQNRELIHKNFPPNMPNIHIKINK